MTNRLFQIPMEAVRFTADDAFAAFKSDEFAFQVHGLRLLDSPPEVGVHVDDEGVIRARDPVRVAACRALGRSQLVVWLDVASNHEAFNRLGVAMPIEGEERVPAPAERRWHMLRFVEPFSDGAADRATDIMVDWFEAHWSHFEHERGSRPFAGPVLLDRRLGSLDPTVDLQIWTPWSHYDAAWLREYVGAVRRIHDEVQPLRWSNAGIMRPESPASASGPGEP